MKKALGALLVLTVIVCRGYAIPARPVPVAVVQPDGSYLNVCLIGDERFHFKTTEDRMPIVQGDDGSYYYAIIKGEHLECSKILAHNNNERSHEENEYVNSNREKLIVHVEALRDAELRQEIHWNDTRRSSKTRSVGQPTSYQGKKKGLVILVNFANLSMVTEDCHDEFYQQFNQIGYCRNNHIGSVHDYFYDQSYGVFDLAFDVVGPVTVSREYAYYGANSSWSSRSDIHVGQMISEACRLANEEINYAD